MGTSLTNAQQFALAIELGEPLAKDHPSVSMYQMLGVAAFKSGQWEQGIEYARRAIRLEPDFYGNYNLLGQMLEKVGRFDEAATAFERTLQFNPKEAIARGRLVEVRKWADEKRRLGTTSRPAGR